MKQTLFMTIVWILFTALPLHAQWNIGGLLNINSSKVSVNPNPASEEYSSRFGFGIGGVLDRQLTDQFEIHAEPMYLQKGAQVDDNGEEVNFETSYFELPIMIRYNFHTTGNTIPYAMTGPSFGYLLNAKFVAGLSEVDVKDQIKNVDFGIGFGGGLKIPKENVEFFAEARYTHGLANVNDDASDGTTVHNRGIQILFGFTVPFNRKRSTL